MTASAVRFELTFVHPAVDILITLTVPNGDSHFRKFSFRHFHSLLFRHSEALSLTSTQNNT
jgi:hypothetical protein